MEADEADPRLGGRAGAASGSKRGKKREREEPRPASKEKPGKKKSKKEKETVTVKAVVKSAPAKAEKGKRRASAALESAHASRPGAAAQNGVHGKNKSQVTAVSSDAEMEEDEDADAEGQDDYNEDDENMGFDDSDGGDSAGGGGRRRGGISFGSHEAIGGPDVPLKKGKFSNKERDILRRRIDQYMQENNLGANGLDLLCSKQRQPELRGAWYDIAKCLPNRSVSAIYHFCTRAFARKKTGKWTDDEIELLKMYVEKHGRCWTKVGQMLNRLPCSCRDKYRLVEHEHKTGKWTPEEDQRLVELVSESCPGDKPPREGIQWTVIANSMGNRSHSACRNRWYNVLYANLTRAHDWTNSDDLQLIEAILQQGAEDESEVRWNQVSNKWTTTPCHYRWKQLMKRVQNYANLPFPELARRLRDQLREAQNYDSSNTGHHIVQIPQANHRPMPTAPMGVPMMPQQLMSPAASTAAAFAMANGHSHPLAAAAFNMPMALGRPAPMTPAAAAAFLQHHKLPMPGAVGMPDMASAVMYATSPMMTMQMHPHMSHNPMQRAAVPAKTHS